MHVYIIECGEYHKIGLAERPERRIKDLQVGNPTKLKLVHSVRYKTRRHARGVEQLMHIKLKANQKQGEWFSGSLESIIQALGEVEDEFHMKGSKQNLGRKKFACKTKRDIKRRELYRSISKSTDKHVTIDRRNLLLLLTKGIGLPKSVADVLEIPMKGNKGWKKRVIGFKMPREVFLANCDPSIK